LLICFNGLSDGSFGGSLAQFSQISSGESFSQLSEEIKGNVLGDGALSEDCLEDGAS
jgi:hypothetical protein